MFNSSSLSDDQKAAIHQWAADRAQINDIQLKMAEEFDVKITYMEARFLVLDLAVEIQAEEPEKEVEDTDDVAIEGNLDEDLEHHDLDDHEDLEDDVHEDQGPVDIKVTFDSIERPGLAVSGSVTFSDGENALWGIDQTGRFMLDSETEGYKPTEEDLIEFQNVLRAKFEKMG